VARAARRFPDILQMLGEGSLGLATVRLLAPQLTADNSEQLFAAAAGKTKREVEQMLGGRFPRPDVPTLGPQAAGGSFAPYAAGSLRAAGCEHGGGPALGQSVVGALTGAGETPDRQAARATDRYEIRFTATAETREKLRLAQDLLRPAVPTGDVAQVIDRALTLLIEDQRRKKIGATDRPRTSRGTTPGRRGVAAKVRRTAWNHDEGRCSFVSKGGRRGNESAFIEFDHVVPYGVGGQGTVENIRLLCRAHNAFESERFYGRGRPAKSSSAREELAPP